MIQKKLLKQLLPGFIPLLIFIIADELWGTKIGLLVAIVFGIGGLIYFWIKDKRFDKFILFDTLLIVALGLVSIILDNDVFFKLKPALIGVLVCLIMAISAFTPKNILLGMSQRYLQGVEFNEAQYKQLRESMKVMFWLFLFHTSLVFYSVWYLSNEAWVFISGPLFYILFGVYFVFEFVKNKHKSKQLLKEEWLPLVNKNGEVVGKAPRSICHSDKRNLHPVVHLHVINSKGELYIQKRPKNKLIQPNKWDTAVGGHISFGESVEESLKREASEEIGISNFKAQLVNKYIWESDVESEYVFCFYCIYNGEFVNNPEELAGGKYWSKKDIDLGIEKDLFTPNFINEYQQFIRKKLV